MKKQEVTYVTEVTTMVQEPRVADVPPVVLSEYEKELIQRRMAQQTQMMQSFISETVLIYMGKVIFPIFAIINHIRNVFKIVIY